MHILSPMILQAHGGRRADGDGEDNEEKRHSYRRSLLSQLKNMRWLTCPETPKDERR